MGTHRHDEQHGQGLVAAARSVLTSAGEQWTTMRGEVFQALVAQDRPTSAYDIAERVGRIRGRRVAANSVYRILDLFVRTNLARRLESANAYLANPHPGCQHDCIFLICDACGLALHLDDDDLTGALRQAGGQAGFDELRPVIEVRGRCARCGLLVESSDP